MDRFKELQDLIFIKKLDCKRSIKKISNQMQKISVKDVSGLTKMTEKIKSVCADINALNLKQLMLVSEEDKIKQMLNGYYEDENRLRSFVYADIHIYQYRNYYGIDKYYSIFDCGNWLDFNRLDDAKKYAMSAIRTDWLEYAFNHL